MSPRKEPTPRAPAKKAPAKKAPAKKAPAKKAPSKKSPAKKPSTPGPEGSAATGTDGGTRRLRGEAYRLANLETSRFGIVYDIDGPRVRLGILWFLAALVALAVGVVAVSVLVAGIAALAAAQTSQTLRARWRRPTRAVAAGVAAAIPLAALGGLALTGLAVVVGTFVAVIAASARRPRRTDPVVDAAATVRASVFVGLAAASIVALYRFDIGAAIVVLVLCSAYETGDYLIGSGASNRVEGPASGILTVVAVTAAFVVFQPPPFDAAGLWFYAMLVAVLAPLGQVVASAILPRAGAPAPALRRLDSYVLVGPVWLVLLHSGLGVGV